MSETRNLPTYPILCVLAEVIQLAHPDCVFDERSQCNLVQLVAARFGRPVPEIIRALRQALSAADPPLAVITSPATSEAALRAAWRLIDALRDEGEEPDSEARWKEAERLRRAAGLPDGAWRP